MTDRTVHIDVFFQCEGQTYPVGDGDVLRSDDTTEQSALIATLLHKMAWGYEEAGQREAQDGQPDGDVREVRQRKAITAHGDEFYEVAPGEFVAGMSYSDAVESYRRFGNSTTEDDMKRVFKHLRWEDL